MQKKKESKARMQIVFAVLLFMVTLFGELFTIIKYNGENRYIIMAVFGVFTLIFLYLIMNGLFKLRYLQFEHQKEQYENIVKAEKAAFLLMKKNFEHVESNFEHVNTNFDALKKISKIPTEEIVNAQKGIAKVIINRAHENTEAMMSSNDQVMEMIDDVSAKLLSSKTEIVDSVKNVSDVTIKELILKQEQLLEDVKSMEQRINDSILQTQKLMAEKEINLTTKLDVPECSININGPLFNGNVDNLVGNASFSGQVANVDPAQIAPEMDSESETILSEMPEFQSKMVAEPEVAPELEMVAEPEETPESEMVAEPEVAPEPEMVAEPEVAPEPEMVAEPEETPELEMVAEPEETPELEMVAELEETPEPEMMPDSENIQEPSEELSDSEMKALLEEVSPVEETDIDFAAEEKKILESLTGLNSGIESELEEMNEEIHTGAEPGASIVDYSADFSLEDDDDFLETYENNVDLSLLNNTSELNMNLSSTEEAVSEMPVENVETSELEMPVENVETSETDTSSEILETAENLDINLDEMLKEAKLEEEIESSFELDFEESNKVLDDLINEVNSEIETEMPLDTTFDIEASMIEERHVEDLVVNNVEEEKPKTPEPSLVESNKTINNIEKEKPKAPMPDLSDPNKALNADEIAALFANMGVGDVEESEPAPAPEPVEEKPPMPNLSDPNKALSPDEIAALIANM